MGKSLTPYSNVIDRIEAEFAAYRRALRKEDQQRLDRLFNLARRHTASGVVRSDPDPFRTVMVSVLIELLRLVEEGDDATRDRGAV